jgi:peptide/nickel transport system permease protein
MWRFVLKRVLTIIPIMLGATFIVFSIMSFAPGDAVGMLASDASQEEKTMLRQELGLDDPLLIQYARYVLNLLQGNMGISYKSGAPVTEELAARIPYTALLAVVASIITIILAIPLGVIAAIRQNTFFDTSSMVFCLMGISMPPFWLGLLLILFFGVKLKMLPISGSGSWAHVVMPAITQSVAGLATIARVTRSSMLEVIRQDYIRTARAKGISHNKVIRRHALKNSLLPTITVAGLQVGALLSGAVVTETVFSWPGIGRFLVSSISWRDTPCVLGCVVIFVLTFSIINLIVDILYGFVDPRIKAIYKKA